MNRIFIGGYMHSGTSLLQNILGGHSGIFTPKGEIKFIEFLPAIQRRFPLVSEEQKLAFLKFCFSTVREGVPYIAHAREALAHNTLQEIPPGFKLAASGHLDIFFQVLDYYASENQKGQWLEKSPNNIFFSDLIFRHLPDALFVIIVRDPRDVLSSKKVRVQAVDKKFTGEKLRLKKLEKKYSPLIDSLSWSASNKAGLQLSKKHPKNTCLIQYEHLVSEPEKAVRKICSFLGIPFEPQMLDISFSNAAEKTRNQKGIFQNSGQFRQKLSHSEIAFIQRVLKKDLQDLNYELYAPIPFLEKVKSFKFYLTGLFGLAERLIARFKLFGRGYFTSFLKITLRKLRPEKTIR